MQPRHQCASMVGRWRISPPPFLAFLGLLLVLTLGVILDAAPTLAEEVKQKNVKESWTRLNTSGRTISFAVPVKDAEVELGEVTIQITADDKILIQKAEFAEHAEPVVGAAVAQKITAMADVSGFVAVEQFEAAGAGVRFDFGLQELQLTLSPDQRPTGDLNIGGHPTQQISADLTEPAFISGYLNIIAGLDQDWSQKSSSSQSGSDLGGRLEFDSAIRVGGIVFENRAEYDGTVDANICPIDAHCIYGHVAGVKRESSRAVYDIPSEQIRVEAGDTEALAIPLQRLTDVLGISIEKSARKLNPGENTSGAGGGSFRLENNSSVDVIVNGAVVQRLQLRPGNYNIRDLPLTAGANSIELNITAENGERRTETFSSYSDPKLLASGKSEWALSGGVPSYLFDNQRTYSNDYLGTGYVKYGLTDAVTGEANIQGDLKIVMGGVGADFQTLFGVFGLHGAGSMSSATQGAAANFDWSLSNFSGLAEDRRENLNFSAEFRSTDFHTPGEFLNGADGILYSEFNYWLRLGASYSMPVTDEITATLSGRYQFGDESRQSAAPLSNSGDRFGADLTLATTLSPTANASLLMGYSNELIDRNFDDKIAQAPEFRVALRLNVRPDDATTITSSYDTLGEQAQVSAYRSETSGIDHWDTSVDVQDRIADKTAGVSANVGYRGNRGEVRLSHYADAEGFTLDNFDSTPIRQRTSLRVGTSIAFAGGSIAFGAPVRGGAFAIVAPHESIGNNEITVGTTGNERAIADAWGNALVTDLPAYSPGSIPVDVAYLPLGYSLGRGAFDTYAPYKAGYAIEVGSSYSVSVYGVFEMADGKPVALVTGTAHPDGKPDKHVLLFTNGEGKFGAEGMAPGRWIAVMASDSGPLRYVIDVPDGSNGFVKIGTLHPVEGTAQ